MHYRYRRRDIPEPPNLNEKVIFATALSLLPDHDTVDYPKVSRVEAQAQVKKLAAVVDRL